MALTVRQAADRAVRALQDWYAADSYASDKGLYHWDDPNFDSHAGGSFIAGLIKTFGYTDPFQDTYVWWNAANSITALIDYMAVTGDTTFEWVVDNTFNRAQNAYTINKGVLIAAGVIGGFITGAAAGMAAAALGASLGSLLGPLGAVLGFLVGFLVGALVGGAAGATAAALAAAATFARVYLNNFINPLTIDSQPGLYDDEAWWALAWMRAYDLTGNDKYLAMSVTIYNDMTNAWDDTCNGGIYWAKNHKDPGGNGPYKNAIANELFLAVTAGLCRRLMTRGINWVYFQGTANIFQAHANYLWVVTEFGSHQTWVGQQSLNSTPFVTPSGRVYFQGTDNRLLAVNSDGSDFTWIGNNIGSPQWTNSTPFVVPGDAIDIIYFRGTNEGLFKINSDGSGFAQIGPNSTSDTPFVVDDWVYFRGTANWLQRHILWKVRTEGSAQSQIGDNYTSSTPFVTPDGQWVYFRGDDDTLWKVDVNGGGQQQIGKNAGSPQWTSDTPVVVGDTVYFQGTANWFQRHILWRINTDGNDAQQIGNNYTNSTPFVTPGGWVFFQGDDNKLWKVFNDGSQQYQIGNNTTQSTPFVTTAGPIDAIDEFKSWADREWRWFSDSGLINSNNLINDSLTTSVGRDGQPRQPCQQDLSMDIWTYNQGVILGALCDMAEITDDKALQNSYLQAARRIADALIRQPRKDPVIDTTTNETIVGGISGVDQNGILTEYTDVRDNGNDNPNVDIYNCQFKGIFVRNLARLCVKTATGRYAAFIRRNAVAAIKHMDEATGHFGHRWDEFPDITDFVRQTSAVDLLNAALEVQSVTTDLSYLDPLLGPSSTDQSYLDPLLRPSSTDQPYLKPLLR
jgi:predicted alpha-1,6-mannanase (GH76 family)